MARDLKIDIDNIRLNVRVGVIVRHNNDVIIEISTTGRNSVIPGGRIQIGEHSKDALIREMKEEMNFNLNKDKLTQVKVFENFFEYEGKKFHELYFVYEYILDEKEYNTLKVENNKDNSTTYFKYVPKTDLAKYNVLPLDLYDIINN